jgi:NAD(P)-dependent dehydrogenase (short-subunit alcohol dehydrogenase family)
MAPTPATTLRPGLLQDARIVLAGGAAEVGAAAGPLGALVLGLPSDLLDEAATEAAAAVLGGVDALVIDAAAPFAAAGGGYGGYRRALDGTWTAARAVARAAWLDRPEAGGALVLLAPAPGAGVHAGAARAALENLARTLATEWARHGVRTAAVLPEDGTDPATVAGLACFLASPAGAYVSGAVLRPGPPPPAPRG